jgi:FKBP-type peptidyl-prolyl cis-trans isomerase
MKFKSTHWSQGVVAAAALLALSPVAWSQSGAPAAAPSSGAPAAAVVTQPETSPPATPEESSYAIGLVFGSQLHGAGMDETLAVDALMRGLKDGLGGKNLSAEDRQRAMQMVRAGHDRIADRNHEAAKAFLAKNGAAAGVTTTASGLQYEIVEPGDTKSASPALHDRVTVHYRGRLLDGTEFDNSDNHPQAATFNVGAVIKGWVEALQLMRPGAKWRLFVPPQLAYDLNSPPNIPPGSLLVFDLELVKVEPPAVMSAPAAKPQAAQKGATAAKPGKPAKAAPRAAPGQ